MPSLDDLIPQSLPYPIRGAIIRAIRTVISAIMAFVITGLADGTLLGQIKLIPPEYAPLLVLTITPTIMAIDKYLRERGFEDEQQSTDNPDEVEPPDTTDVDATNPNVDVETTDTGDVTDTSVATDVPTTEVTSGTDNAHDTPTDGSDDTT